MREHAVEHLHDEALRFIQALLGHADLSSTQIYTNVSILKLKEIHAATHPARLERQARTPGTADRQAEDRLAAAALIDALGAEAEDERAHR